MDNKQEALAATVRESVRPGTQPRWTASHPRKRSLFERALDHLPLALLGGGAGSVFLANIIAKNVFTPEQFVYWAYLITLVTFFFSFSLLGSEQLIIRSAKNHGRLLVIPRDSVWLISASFLVFLFIYLFVLDGRLLQYRLGATAVPVLTSIGAIQVVYQLERACNRLFASQFVLNGWKLVLVPLLIFSISWMARERRAEFVIAGALLIGFVAAAGIFQRARSNLLIKSTASDARQVFVPLMLSLGIMAVLGIADRVVLEKVEEPSAFAEYVYLVTIIAAPFNILSSYFGFRQAVRYRYECSSSHVRSDALRTIALATGLVAAWSALCYITRNLSGVSTDFTLWVLLGAVAVVRCGYSVLSAAMGVRGTAAAIYTANLLTAGGLLLYAYIGIAAGASVAAISAGYLAVWSIRFVAYFWLVGTCDRSANQSYELRIG